MSYTQIDELNYPKRRIEMIACFFLGSVLAYGLVMAFYRLHVHPLSKYPGPWLAAVTGLYEIYFTAWGVGSFEDEIDRMHQKYGKRSYICHPARPILIQNRTSGAHYSRRSSCPGAIVSHQLRRRLDQGHWKTRL